MVYEAVTQTAVPYVVSGCAIRYFLVFDPVHASCVMAVVRKATFFEIVLSGTATNAD